MLSAKTLDFTSRETAVNNWRLIEIDNLNGNSLVAVCPNQFWADHLMLVLNQKESCTTERYEIRRPGEPI